MIEMKYGPFTVGEAFFRIPPGPHQVDLLRCRQLPSAEGMKFVDAQGTLLVDLRRSRDAIFDGFQKDTRYEIRRAETKDGVRCDLLEGPALTDADLATFASAFQAFTDRKGITPLNPRRVGALRRDGSLCLSVARGPGGEPLAWHLYLTAQGRARLLHSLSAKAAEDPKLRSLAGRANRLLHWADMVAFQAMGLDTYDFGGFYLGDSDPEKLRINRFKAEFCGTRSIEYNGFIFLTLKGRIAGRLYGLARRLPFLPGH
jgi:hypothetical protein